MTVGMRFTMALLLVFGLVALELDAEGWEKILREKAGIEMPLNGSFQLSNEKNIDNEELMLEFKSETDLLRIRSFSGITKERAQKLRDDRVFLTDNLFIVQPSPYADALSRFVGSPEESKPTKFQIEGKSMWITAYSIKANKRYIYGESIDENNYYVSAYILCYCMACGTFNEIKYFTPKSEPINMPERIINAVHCSCGN